MPNPLEFRCPYVPTAENASLYYKKLRYDKRYQQQQKNAREKKKLRRFILITAVKFYSEMKTPTQKMFWGATHHYHYQTTGCWSIPTYCTTKRISSSRNARKRKEAWTIHPHHCSKILFQNEDSHAKIIFGVSHHYHDQNTGCSIIPESHPIVLGGFR